MCTQIHTFKRGFMTTRAKSNTTELSWHFWHCWCDLRTQPHHRTFEASSTECVCVGGWRGSSSHWDINASTGSSSLKQEHLNYTTSQMDSWGKITASATIYQTELYIHIMLRDCTCFPAGASLSLSSSDGRILQ